MKYGLLQPMILMIYLNCKLFLGWSGSVVNALGIRLLFRRRYEARRGKRLNMKKYYLYHKLEIHLKVLI